MTKYKIRVISNGYLMTDSNNCEYYYSSIEDFADTIKRDLQKNIGYIGEFRLEYSIERANKVSVAEQKDALIAEYKNALLVITNTECILEHDTIALIKEIAQDALGEDQK